VYFITINSITMKFVKTTSKKWEAKPGGYSKKIFLNERDLNYPGGLVQELKIKPGDICANHYHKKQTEIFYFTSTNGWFEVEGKKIDIEKGDVLVVEPNDMHRAGNESDKDFVYVAFKFNYSSEDSYYE